MQDEKGKIELLKTKINPSVLYELGGMYTTVSQTLREFTQNAFDSCANNVFINIDIINDVITISDDGIGMNDYVVRNHYKDVGFSTKNKNGNIGVGTGVDDSDKMPKVPSELMHNLKRTKIGSKGMGKLSWILLADSMETITTTVDMGDSIKLEFSANDLENNKLSHVSKNEIENGHGTILKLKGLKIKDFGRYNKSENDKNSSSSSSDLGSNEIEELINTVGFLGVAFPDFRVYLSVNSEKEKITKQLIIKRFYSGKSVQARDNGVFDYIDYKVDYKTVGGSKKVPYDFMLIIPEKNSGLSSGSPSEFWLLSQYMGVKKLTWVKGLSGYLNIDNVKLVANRNDFQSSENDLLRILKDKICDKLAIDMVAVYKSGSVDSGISILDENQNGLLEFVYQFTTTYSQLKMIVPYLKFKFYLEGEHRLGEFVGKEQTIYYYFSNDDNSAFIADKASYCGYKCFEVMNESIVINTLDNAYNYSIKDYIQNIEKLPKDAYESAGSSVTPIGGLKDVLGNLGPIFDSFAFAIVKIESNISRLKSELSTKKFSAAQKKERQKEVNKLEKYLLSLKNSISVSDGVSSGGVSSGGMSSGSTSSANISNIVKGVDKGRLKLSSEHYIKYNMLDREYLIGFASLEDEATIANIVNKRFITFNLKNEYIKDALDERNPIRQVILLLPLVCHEICHEWSSTHDEVFQMMFNALLIPSLDHLTKQIFAGDLKVKAVEDICINDKGEQKEKGYYHGKSVCSICRLLLATPETVKTGVCSNCAKKMKRKENK